MDGPVPWDPVGPSALVTGSGKPNAGFVAIRAGGSAPGPAGRGSGVEQWAAKRQLYVDNLKVILIAAVIAGHAVLGNSELDAWSYADVREVTLRPAVGYVLLAVAAPFALLVIPLLFLIAGLLTPQSLDRKGPGRFVRDRLLRLGVPFAVSPCCCGRCWSMSGSASWEKHPGSGRTSAPRGTLDTGVLWFVGALLVFSLVYAGWVWVRRGHEARPRLGEIKVGHLLLLAAAVTVATYLVRLVLPYESDNKYVDLNMWEWPACAAQFGLGIMASRAGWLTAVPDRLRRKGRTVTLVVVGAAAAFAAAAIALGVAGEQLWGGWYWPALVFAAGESTLSVFGPVWLLGVAQRRLNRSFRWARPVISRSSYGTFMLQGVVLIGLAIACGHCRCQPR